MLSVSKYLVYALCDPAGEIRYIGKSSCGLERPKAHMHPSSLARSKTYTRNWIVGLKNQGMKPQIQVIQRFHSHLEAIQAEQYWIKYFTDAGANLTNISSGGEFGILNIDFSGENNPFHGKKHSKSTKSVMAARRRGQIPGNAAKKVQDNSGNIFNSATEAAKFYSYKRTRVKNVLCGYIKQTRDGITFRYI